jgi:hypothetical protein
VRFFTGLTVVLIAASTITAQGPPKFSPAQQEVINAHTARIQAVEKWDYATYARLVADDCINSDDDGVLDTNPKAHLLERWRSCPLLTTTG